MIYLHPEEVKYLIKKGIELFYAALDHEGLQDLALAMSNDFTHKMVIYVKK